MVTCVWLLVYQTRLMLLHSEKGGTFRTRSINKIKDLTLTRCSLSDMNALGADRHLLWRKKEVKSYQLWQERSNQFEKKNVNEITRSFIGSCLKSYLFLAGFTGPLAILHPLLACWSLQSDGQHVWTTNDALWLAWVPSWPALQP